jgi:hypothetical protein
MDRHLTPLARTFPCALALCATPALAQDEPPEETDLEHLHLPGYEAESERAAGSSTIRFEIAPELVSHNPLGAGSQTSNALDLSLRFSTRQTLSDGLEIAFNAGASKTIDNGSTSELAAGTELRTRPGASGLSGFVRYNIARDYTDFFDQGLATTHAVTPGLRYGRDLGGVELGLQFAPRWEESSGQANDLVAVNAWGEVVVPVVGDKIHLIVDASAERRWYEHTDPLLLIKPRDWRLASYVGLDLAGLIDTPQRWVHDLGFGIEWLEVSSNVDSAERSDLSLLPAFSIGFRF